MKAILGYVLFLFVISCILFTGEGWQGLKPIMLVESIMMVVLGTAVIVFFSFPLKTVIQFAV